MGILIAIGFIAVVLIVRFIFYGKYEQQRTKKIQEVAEKMGFYFNPMPQAELLSSLENFDLLKSDDKNPKKKAHNVWGGNYNGVFWTIFDNDQYLEAKLGRSSFFIYRTVAYTKTDGVNFPKFCLRPEVPFFPGVAKQLQKYLPEIPNQSTKHPDNISFEDAPLFTKKYQVSGPNKEAIKKLFSSQLLSFFEKRTEEKGKITIETEGNKFIIFRFAKMVTAGGGIQTEKPEDLPNFLEEISTVLQLFKESYSAT